MIYYNTNKESISKAEVLEFIHSVDKDFNPRLEGRVCIGEWVDKLFQSAELITAEMDNKIVGLCSFYANNIADCNAYICYVAVSSSCRNQGVASQMLENCFNICRNQNMKTIAIHTNNPAAKRLYESKGFKLKNIQLLEILNITKFYLEKQL